MKLSDVLIIFLIAVICFTEYSYSLRSDANIIGAGIVFFLPATMWATWTMNPIMILIGSILSGLWIVALCAISIKFKNLYSLNDAL